MRHYYIKKINSIILLFTANIVFVCFVFLAAEIYCRAKKICKLNEFRYNDWPSMKLFRPSNFLPYEVVPNIRGYTNSLGMRDKEYKLKKETGLYRIAVLGDSITMYGRYTDYLEELLNNRLKDRFEVWNCGIGGQGIKEYYYNFAYKYLKSEPDMLIIGFCLDDFEMTPVIFKVDKTMRCYRPFRLFKHNWDNWLYCHSNFYRYILTVLEQKMAKKAGISREGTGRLYMSKIKEIVAQKNIRFFVVIFPYFRNDSESTFHYKEMKKVIDELGIECIDLHNVFNKEERHKFITPPDYIHPNYEAHRIVAEVLYRKISNGRQ